MLVLSACALANKSVVGSFGVAFKLATMSMLIVLLASSCAVHVVPLSVVVAGTGLRITNVIPAFVAYGCVSAASVFCNAVAHWCRTD